MSKKTTEPVSLLPPFKPEDEVKLYIPSKRDEILLTRDWTFTAHKYWASGLFHALGFTKKVITKHTYQSGARTLNGQPEEVSYTRKENVLTEEAGDKMQITLLAGCILALDNFDGTHATLRCTFAPKAQGFVKRSLRPRFMVEVRQMNNKIFFLPATEPKDLEINDDEETIDEEG